MRLQASLGHPALPDSTAVLRLGACEGLSVLFDVRVEIVHDSPDLDLEAMLWTEAVARLVDVEGDGQIRFHGLVEEAEYLGPFEAGFRYGLRMRPWIHGLAHRVRSRIFQDLSAVEVIGAVFRDAGVPSKSVVWSLTGRYPKREYCVQYRESELDFVLRLLEEEGIFYAFEHAEDGHVMHLGDSPAKHSAMDGNRVLPFARRETSGDEHVTELVLSTQLFSDGQLARDYWFMDPARALEAEQRDDSALGLDRMEYPGRFTDSAEGARRVKNRLREAALEKYVLRGRSNCLRLAPGRLFDLVDAQPESLDRDYLVTEVEHVFVEPMRDLQDGRQPYLATFTAVPGDTEFRPPRRTPRPRIAGKESAVVTGPGGEEIHTDEMGRVKVHFYWDREGKVDDTASCWIRTQQLNTSGSMVIPRVGWEVSVGFLDGDPDRPVVMHRLYNQETMAPYALPGAKARSALQSSSSPGGGGTNELRLDDTKGSMDFFVHASRDMALVAGHDMSEEVALDACEEVGLELKSLVGGREDVSVAVNQGTSVTGDSTGGTVGAKTVSVGGGDDVGVKSNYSLTVDGSRSETIGALANVLANHVVETFDGDCTRDVGAALCINSATALVHAVAASVTETVGGAKLVVARKAVSETIKGSKVLTAGLVVEKTGGDIGVAAGAAMALTVGGTLRETCDGDYTVGARLVTVAAAGGVVLEAGGSKLVARGGKLSLKASSLGVSGGPVLKLKGKVNFKG